MTTTPLTRLAAVALGTSTAAALAFAAATLPATPAHAEGTATVHVEVTADPTLLNTAFTDQPTALTVSGSGFQSIDKGFGGIYLLFGWVDPADDWRPSAGGTTGSSYLYQVDDESAPAGYQQFISFPGGSTEAQASGGDINADGTWSTTLTVAGPSFQATDRDGNATTVDCLTSQCGVITIGAHGVANANNETFTPVTFVSSAAAAAGPTTTNLATDPNAASPAASATPATGAAAGSAAGSDAEPTATPAAVDASADAGSSSGTGWMIGSAIALAALLGVGVWRLIVWRRRAA